MLLQCKYVSLFETLPNFILQLFLIQVWSNLQMQSLQSGGQTNQITCMMWHMVMSEVAQSCSTRCDPYSCGTVARQAPPSMGFSRQEYWSGLPFPSPGDLPDQGIKPNPPALAGRLFTTEPPGKPSRFMPPIIYTHSPREPIKS